MNAITLLKSEHQKALTLIGLIENPVKAPGARSREDVIEELVALLRRHTEIEEKVFYSALTEFDQARALVGESLRGHRRIDRALAEFDTLRYASSGGNLHALFNDLKRSFAEHVERDEARLLPEAERLLGGARLERMLCEMEQAKDGWPDAATSVSEADRS
jgi:hemerythrin-like domain-containing protein